MNRIFSTNTCGFNSNLMSFLHYLYHFEATKNYLLCPAMNFSPFFCCVALSTVVRTDVPCPRLPNFEQGKLDTPEIYLILKSSTKMICYIYLIDKRQLISSTHLFPSCSHEFSGVLFFDSISLDLFLTAHPEFYQTSISAPIGHSNYNLITFFPPHTIWLLNLVN